MNYNDLIGKVTRWGITREDGKGEPEPLRYLITDVEGDGMLIGLCLSEESPLHGLMRTGMDPERVRRGLERVISLEAERAKRQERP
jgi:hypothetical protein